MLSLLYILLILMFKCPKNSALSCYQCSIKHSNDECNANNATSAVECQPTFDTCITIVLKPEILDRPLITKYCTKRNACDQQEQYTRSLMEFSSNNGRKWGYVKCCSDRDLCNVDHVNQLKPTRSIQIVFIFILFLLSRQ